MTRTHSLEIQFTTFAIGEQTHMEAHTERGNVGVQPALIACADNSFLPNCQTCANTYYYSWNILNYANDDGDLVCVCVFPTLTFIFTNKNSQISHSGRSSSSLI